MELRDKVVIHSMTKKYRNPALYREKHLDVFMVSNYHNDLSTNDSHCQLGSDFYKSGIAPLRRHIYLLPAQPVFESFKKHVDTALSAFRDACCALLPDRSLRQLEQPLPDFSNEKEVRLLWLHTKLMNDISAVRNQSHRQLFCKYWPNY